MPLNHPYAMAIKIGDGEYRGLQPSSTFQNGKKNEKGIERSWKKEEWTARREKQWYAHLMFCW